MTNQDRQQIVVDVLAGRSLPHSELIEALIDAGQPYAITAIVPMIRDGLLVAEPIRSAEGSYIEARLTHWQEMQRRMGYG